MPTEDEIVELLSEFEIPDDMESVIVDRVVEELSITGSCDSSYANTEFVLPDYSALSTFYTLNGFDKVFVFLKVAESMQEQGLLTNAQQLRGFLLRQCVAFEDTIAQNMILEAIADAWSSVGRHDSSAYYHMQIVSLLSGSEDEFYSKECLPDVLMALAFDYARMNDRNSSIKLARKAMATADTSNGIAIRGHILIGRQYLELHILDSAAKHLAAANQVPRFSKDIGFRMALMNELLMLHFLKEEYDLAASCGYRFRSMADSLGLGDYKDYATTLISAVHGRSGNYELALQSLGEVKNSTNSEFLYAKSIVHYHLGQYDSATKYANLVLEVENDEALYSQIGAAEVLYKIFESEGHPTKALKMYQLHRSLLDSAEKREDWKKELLSIYELESLQEKRDDSLQVQSVIARLSKESRIEKRRNNIYYGVAGSALLLGLSLLGVFAHRRNRNPREVMEGSATEDGTSQSTTPFENGFSHTLPKVVFGNPLTKEDEKTLVNYVGLHHPGENLNESELILLRDFVHYPSSSETHSVRRDRLRKSNANFGGGEDMISKHFTKLYLGFDVVKEKDSDEKETKGPYHKKELLKERLMEILSRSD